MSKINKADIKGLFTGRRRIDVMALLVGFKPIQPSQKADLTSRMKVVLCNLINVLLLLAFIYFAGKSIIWSVVAILASWVAYRIVVYIVRSVVRFRFGYDGAVA